MKKICFSRNVAILRKNTPMTQEVLAEKCGVSRQAVTKWEAGNYPDLDMIPKLCEVFNVTADELLFGNLEDKNISSDTMQELFKRFDEMKSIVQMQVTGLSEMAAELYKQYKGNDVLDREYYQDNGSISCALDLAEKGEYKEAIEDLEEALINGNTSAVSALIDIYNEFMKYMYFEENEEDLYDCEKVYAAKLEVYGKIYREELERVYPGL